MLLKTIWLCNYLLESIDSLTQSIEIPKPIYIFGKGRVGLNTLVGGTAVKFIVDFSIVGLKHESETLQLGASYFLNFAVVNSENYFDDSAAIGMTISRFNYFTFNNVGFHDFRKNKGLKIHSEGYAVQYESFYNCIFGQNLIGAYVKKYKGLHFLDCMFDGNSNGS